MFSHLPQLNSIRVFDSAARLKSFKEAALELNVTPTAVSHQIRALEERLGTLLFERKTRHILLTPEGEKLAQVAHQSLTQIATVFEEISGQKTRLCVSTTSSFAAQWLVPNLEGFYRLYPDLEVVIKTEDALEDISKDRRIDLAIRYGEFEAKDKTATKLVTEEFGMYATGPYIKAFPDLEKASLLETKWKNPSLKPMTWQGFFELDDEASHRLNIRAYDQEHHLIQAALAGQGVALVSSLLIETALEQNWLEPHPKGKSLEGLSYYVLTQSETESSRKTLLFKQWLLDVLKKEG
ncbi:substrate-binding transcriptional regulator, LysR family protein [Marinomonas sp. MED121]|uniref:LysR substrate-binding domain-containing protein n=1 Tax=Marinomonas sp. MED121 TaxID=314277 RepID=UPI0000691004|nr:LysR substrate-binding domain-containing protein [Marinomonas sp. MED121]EAQ67311.1 substrate-binding transcriptional regulator, LysR family protein [Marinomonas sp. MED121]